MDLVQIYKALANLEWQGSENPKIQVASWSECIPLWNFPKDYRLRQEAVYKKFKLLCYCFYLFKVV